MRIESFWARGFRSLRDVRIDQLGPFNVFYGPNGSGKSNILAAIETWLRLVRIALQTTGMVPLDAMSDRLPHQQKIERMRGHLAYREAGAPVRAHDFALHSSRRMITLGGTLSDLGAGVEHAEIEVQLDVMAPERPSLHRLATVDGVPLEHDIQGTEAQREKIAALESVDWERKLSLISADRMPRIEAAGERPPDGAEPLSWYFRRGQLKDALFAAQNATSPTMVRALERFRQFMAGSPLHRRPFRAVEDPHTGVRDLREWLPPPLDAHDLSLDLAGLGISQIYWILGQAMLSGAAVVGIEEPEAHLHAPTTGRDLRVLLGRLVKEEHIDQLFIATHSNLFDLDDKGFFDVRLVCGETVVEKMPLDAIDQHLYEPGPTLHALEELLTIAPADKVMFRRSDGSPVTALEMIKMLRDADPIALDYLRNLHAAAVDVVGQRSRRGRAS
jgi:AAA ATPase domain/AAA domain